MQSSEPVHDEIGGCFPKPDALRAIEAKEIRVRLMAPKPSHRMRIMKHRVPWSAILHDALQSAETSSFRRSRLFLILVLDFLPNVLGAAYGPVSADCG
jgi:hypothetical protein